MNTGQVWECVLLCDPRFSYLLLWGPAGWSPLLGYLKQLLCTGPHLLWLPTKYMCACVVLIKKPKQAPKQTTPLPKKFSIYLKQGRIWKRGKSWDFLLPSQWIWLNWAEVRGKKGSVCPKTSFVVAQLLPSVPVWNLKSPQALFSLSGSVKLSAATHC